MPPGFRFKTRRSSRGCSTEETLLNGPKTVNNQAPNNSGRGETRPYPTNNLLVKIGSDCIYASKIPFHNKKAINRQP